jgi:hypothetical protein
MRDPDRITLPELVVSRAVQLTYDGYSLFRRAAYWLGVGRCPGCPMRRGRGHKMDCEWSR